jgi:competence protein ComEA
MITLRTLFATVLAALAFNVFAAVDANRANQAELESVKGIGPALSTKILEARKNGEFRDWTDMVERVQGVGPASAARLSTQGLTVGGTPYTAAPAAERPARAARRTSAETPATPAAPATPAVRAARSN